MDDIFKKLIKKYPVMDHLYRKWKFAKEMDYNPKVEYAIRYYILVRLNKIRHKYKDDDLKYLCKEIIKTLTNLQNRCPGVEANFKEVQELVLQEFSKCESELKMNMLYPELVYRFYHIATLFEVLTVYDDVDENTKNDYLKKAKLATDMALESKEKLKNIPISNISRFSLFNKTDGFKVKDLNSDMNKFSMKIDFSSVLLKKIKICKYDLNQVFNLI
jgi:hypothetical protein